jgi:hypothetical protein
LFPVSGSVPSTGPGKSLSAAACTGDGTGLGDCRSKGWTGGQIGAGQPIADPVILPTWTA